MNVMYFDIQRSMGFKAPPRLYGLNGETGVQVKKGVNTGVKTAASASAVITTVATVAPGVITAAASAIGITASAATIGSVVPIIGTAIGVVVGATIGLIMAKGKGTHQTRFINRVEQVKDIIRDAGYRGVPDGTSKYRLRKTQVRDKVGKGDSYAKEFARLFAYTVDSLNLDNPGLGDYWGSNFPFAMANQGQIKEKSIDMLKKLVKMYPPGTYKGQQPFAADEDGKALKAITSTGKTKVDADGEKYIENIPRDPAGNAVLPASVIKEAEEIEAQEAGINPVLGIGLGILIIGGMMMTGKNQKKAA